jgi:predicted transcriptional regulator
MFESDEWKLKTEVFRMLDPRWTRHRAFILREIGYTWVEIAHALGMHETTVRIYYKHGEKENEHFGTLNYFLSVRARKWLTSKAIDPTLPGADGQALAAVKWYYKTRSGLGAATRDEILNAVDFFREVRPALLTVN